MHWNHVNIAGASPSPRCDSVSALSGDKLYVAGGTAGADNKQDVWWLNLSTRTWVSEQVGHAGPAKITQQTGTFHEGKCLVTWHGHGDALIHNKVHIFDTRLAKWQRMTVKHATPYCASYAREHVQQMDPTHGPIVFGGDDGCYSNRVQQLDLRNTSWLLGESRGEVPSARHSHSTTVCAKENALYVVGGHDGKTCSDIHKLDLTQMRWEALIKPGEGPAVAAASTVHHAGRLYTFGGFCCSTYHNKTTVLELNPPTLRESAARSPPTGRASCSVATPLRGNDFSSNVMYCFGGYDGIDYKDDLVVLQST